MMFNWLIQQWRSFVAARFIAPWRPTRRAGQGQWRDKSRRYAKYDELRRLHRTGVMYYARTEGCSTA
jgi:hypothetical protein